MKFPGLVLFASVVLALAALGLALWTEPPEARSTQAPAPEALERDAPEAALAPAQLPTAAPERAEIAVDAPAAVDALDVPMERSRGPGTDGPRRARIDLTASLHLRLVDAQGRPLAGRSVEARTWGGYHSKTLRLLADGDGWVELELGNFGSRPRHAEFVLEDPRPGRAGLRSPVLNLGPEGEFGLLLGRMPGGDVVLQEPPLLVAGRVVDRRGAAVEGAILELVPKGARAQPVPKAPVDGLWTTSAADGQFEIHGKTSWAELQLVAAASGKALLVPMVLAPGRTELRVALADLAPAELDLVLLDWMAPADFGVYFDAPGVGEFPLQSKLQQNRVVRFHSEHLPAVDGQLVVHWKHFAEECTRVALPLASGRALELPPVTMEHWVRSFELTVRGHSISPRDVRAQLRSGSGRKTYDVTLQPLRLPWLRGPSTVEVQAPGFRVVRVDVVEEKVEVELQLGSSVVLRPPLVGAHGALNLMWHVEPLDPDALAGGSWSRAAPAQRDFNWVLDAPGSYRVRAKPDTFRARRPVPPEWEGLVHVPERPGQTPILLEDPEGNWQEFLEDAAEWMRGD